MTDRVGDIVMVRHGQTEWSLSGRHTSGTDVELTLDGQQQAADLAQLLPHEFAAVWSSPMRRALHTARLAGLEATAVTEDLCEWDYGRYEGLTTATIRRDDPAWTLWSHGCPDGESPEQVTARVDRLLEAVRPWLDSGDVALVGHGHCLRVVAARWIGLSARGGGLLRLDSGSVSRLGHEREQPVIGRWNLTNGGSGR